jgi:DNA-directed RNA polymerase sigma subunit (sigma70/sigma32)
MPDGRHDARTPCRTWPEIARIMGLSNARVQQIHDRALLKLRARLLAQGITAADVRRRDPDPTYPVNKRAQ